MTALHHKLLRDLLHLRGQVIAVTLVVACGIATYVTMNSAYQALLDSQSAYYTQYRFADVFARLKRAPESLATRIAAIPGVAAIQTRVVVEATLDVPNLPEPATGRFLSIPPQPDRSLLNGVFLRQGRWVDAAKHAEVLASESFATANHLQPGSTFSAVINGRWEKLTITGIALSPEYVYEIRGAEVLPDNRRFGVFWMDREALSALYNMKGAFNDLSLTLSPGASEPEVIAQLDRLLEPYGSLGAYGRSDQVSHRFVSDEIAQDRITGIFIPAIFLAIAAFLLHIVLSRLVSTQRAEIGVLKAFGYSNTAIAAHFTGFSLAAVSLGTILGIAVGIWLGHGLADMYTRFFRFPVMLFHPGADLIAVAAAISVAAACLGALSAVRRAAALPPAEAMRPESPPVFHRGFFDAAGFTRILSLSTRMILRNLQRRPAKALLSVLGVSMAVAILIVGRYFYDAIDHILQVQFYDSLRASMNVFFSDPRKGAVTHELAALPGVSRVEPFRGIPARLRLDHRSRRVWILGLQEHNQLHRIVDQDRNVLPVPHSGLLLSAKLASILAAREGSLLRIEVLEGARPIRYLPVAAVVNDLIGLNAFLDAATLRRLLNEADAVSGAYLSVDASQAPALYARFKRTPLVSGVVILQSMMESFRSTIAENLLISTIVLIVFACIIAFGMVYNSARISLSERGHELASLRVLGFTQSEVSLMLLGEQAILTLTAIPLGFALGLGICALLCRAMDSELYRIPLAITPKSYAFAFLVVLFSALASSLLILARLRRLDLVAVLKTRE